MVCCGKAVEYDLGLRRLVELVLDIVEADEALTFGDEQRAVPESHSVGGREALGDDLYLAMVAAVDDRQHLVAQPVADEHRALVPQRH